MIAALVNAQTGTVDNVVVADPAVDAAPDGYVLIAIPDGIDVSVGWQYAPDEGFVVPITDASVQQGLAF